MTAKLTFADKQDRYAVAPPFFEDGVGIEQVAIRPNEQRQAPRVGSEGPQRDCVS